MTYQFLKKTLFLLDPELAHAVTLKSLRLAERFGMSSLVLKPQLFPVEVMGLRFRNPVGVAAGLDKNAEYIDALAMFEFGFIEAGTVVPRAQNGNPRPRLFRLVEDQALINRLGFNNKGLEAFIVQLQRIKYRGILGISITSNNDTPVENTIDDYRTCLAGVYPYASYISLDISCPNVPNKESLFLDGLLPELLQTMKADQTRLQIKHNRYVPIAVKVSPDMSPAETEQVVQMILDARMDGIIATNTTRKRPNLEGNVIAQERGGLSGKPLFELSLQTVRRIHALVQNRIPIIGVGGIMRPPDAIEMMEAGAKLVQVYTGLIYFGPKLLRDIVKSLIRSSRRGGRDL